MITARVEGLSELNRMMRAIEPKLAKSALRSAVNAGAQVIKKEAISLVPVLTGKTKKAIYVQRSRGESSKSRETYKVAVRTGKKAAAKGKDSPFWWHVEFGTQNMPAQPFMRPAFESKKNEAVEAIKHKLLQKLDQLTAGIK